MPIAPCSPHKRPGSRDVHRSARRILLITVVAALSAVALRDAKAALGPTTIPATDPCTNNTFQNRKISATWLGCFAPRMLHWLNEQPIRRVFGESDGYVQSAALRQTRARDAAQPYEFDEQNTISWGVGKGAAPPVYVLQFDAAHSIVRYETPHSGSWSQIAIEFVNTAPPIHFPKTDLTKYTTERGLRLGSSIAAVEHVFGKATFVSLGSGMSVAYYGRSHAGGTKEHTAFVFRAGRVIGMSYASGG
jgi:hypothetical protein